MRIQWACFPQRGIHDRVALSVRLADAVDVGFVVKVRQIAVNDALVEAGRVQIGGLLGDCELAPDLLVRNQPSDSETGRNRL
jgi:hypothetical protein